MLTLPALQSWTDPERDSIAARLEYLSIYIPSSLTWNADYRRFSGKQLSQEVSDLISVSLFRHNVLFSLFENVGAMPQTRTSKDMPNLSRFFLPITVEKEADFVSEFGETLGVGSTNLQPGRAERSHL
jgi:hypothetical protein